MHTFFQSMPQESYQIELTVESFFYASFPVKRLKIRPFRDTNKLSQLLYHVKFSFENLTTQVTYE